MNRYLLLLIFCGLTSCAVQNPYLEPTDLGAKVATIQGYDRTTNLHYWQWAKIQQIDGKEIATQWGPSVTDMKIRVAPGKHTFTIYSAFNDGFLTGPFNGVTQINATLLTGHQYHLNGDLQEKNPLVWIENENNNKITAARSVNYERHQEPLMYVPTR